MQEQDRLQIKKIVDESLEENNNKIYKKIDDKIDEAITTTKEQFDENTKQFEDIKILLKTKANESTVLSWGDERIAPVKLDVDKLKYLHKNGWKNLPDSGIVSRILAEEGIKT